MKESSYKSYDELPLFLNAETMANLLGISISGMYELMHSKISDFSDGELKDMRREAVNNVRRTRGKVPLEEIMKGYYNEE